MPAGPVVRAGRSPGLAAGLLLIVSGLVPVGASDAPFTPPLPYFVDAADAAGLDFLCDHWAKFTGFGPRWFNDVFFCGSPVLGDFNGDGYTDVYFPNTRFSYAFLNDPRDPQDALYINNGDGTFTDASSFAGIYDRGYSMAAAAIDFDDDGDLDIYVVNFRENPPGFNGINSPATVFYVNNGDGTFTQSVPAGLETDDILSWTDNQWGAAVAVGDIDRDGDLDLFRGNYARYAMPMAMPASLQQTTPDYNNLYRNAGGAFERVSVPGTPPTSVAGRTFAVNIADFNGDLWPDIYVANDENRNELYINNGDGNFTDFSAGSGANDPRGAMCSEAADFNGDGNLDLYMSHYEDEVNGYYLGDGDGTFTNAEALGDLDQSVNFLGWGCPSIDFDNDGDLDLFVAHGHMVPAGGEFVHPDDPDDDNGYELPNFLFRNTLRDTGTHDWVEIGRAGLAGPGLSDRFVTSGAMAADFDLDGKQEIVAANNNNVPVSYYVNQAEGLGHWLQVELRGTGSNSHGIGAHVTATAGSLVQTQQMITGRSLGSGSAAPLHFGLGGHEGDVTLTVRWPSGIVQTETVAADHPVRVVEGAGVQLDTLAPRVDYTIDGTPGENGWWTSPSVTVSLAALERGIGAQSGVATLEYRLDGAAAVPYATPFEVAGDGVHRVTLLASDGAGNTAWYPLTIQIDSTLPDGAITRPDSGTIIVQDRPVADATDGQTVMVTPVRTPNEAFGAIDDLLRGTVYELRGRYGASAVPVPPSVEDAVAGSVGSDGMTHIVVGCADATSGVSRVEFFLDGDLRRTDTLAPHEWAADLRGEPVGEHTIRVTVHDEAGLSRSAEIGVVVVPTTQDGILNTIMEGPNTAGGE